MARVKRAVHGKKHRKVVLERAKGYYGNKSRSFRSANEQVMHSLQYAYRDRRARKGDFRQLWIQRINAAARIEGISYSRLIAGLRHAEINVDRKMLADMAVRDPAAFGKIVAAAKAALEAHEAETGARGRLLSEAALSFRHQRVQRLRRLVQRASVRREQRAFVAEGAKILESALDAGAPVEAVFHAPSAELGDGALELLARVDALGIRRHLLEKGVIERVADTVTPQPLLAVVAMPEVPLEAALGAAISLVLVDVRDPGNVGAILRSADAAGVDAVLCCAGTGDCYNPKAVRASAGSLFHLPIVQGPSATEALAALRAAGVVTVATSVTGGADYATAVLDPPLALVFGNEANGLDAEIEAACDQAVSIPIAGGAESLNVAMAATILVFELARRRRAEGGAGFSMQR